MDFLFDIFLYSTSSITLSITVLVLILFLRTRDRILRHLLTILLPLLINFFILYLYRTITTEAPAKLLVKLAPLVDLSALSLAGGFISLFFVCLLVYSTTSYILELIPIDSPALRTGRRILLLLTALLFIIQGITLIGLIRENRIMAQYVALWEFFPFASLLLSAGLILGAFYYNRVKIPEKRRQLRTMMLSLGTLIPFILIDLVFLKNGPIRLTYICYVVFAINAYHYVMRYYFTAYETPPGKEAIGLFCSRFGVSKREEEIIELMIRGLSNKMISERLYISVNTVKTHAKNIYKKLGVSSRIQLLHRINEGHEDY